MPELMTSLDFKFFDKISKTISRRSVDLNTKKVKLRIVICFMLLTFLGLVLALVFWYRDKTKFITLDGEFTERAENIMEQAAQEITIVNEARYQEIERLLEKEYELRGDFESKQLSDEEFRQTRPQELEKIENRLSELGVYQQQNQYASDGNLHLLGNPPPISVQGFHTEDFYRIESFFQDILVDKKQVTLYIEVISLDYQITRYSKNNLYVDYKDAGFYLSGTANFLGEMLRYIYLKDESTKEWKLIYSGNRVVLSYEWYYSTVEEKLIEYTKGVYDLKYYKYPLEQIVRYGLSLDLLGGKPLNCISKTVQVEEVYPRTGSKYKGKFKLCGQLYPENVPTAVPINIK